jgi:hypothetical protein
MDETTLAPPLPILTPTETPQLAQPRVERRRPPRPARPRATTTVSAAILTDRGLAEGYVALPLARLMAHRVWASVETLNQQLTVLEQHSFTRMTSDPAFEGQGARFAQLLRAYATLTEAVAALGQRLAQNRLTTLDRQLLATGDLALLLPPDSAEPTSSIAAPAVATPPTETSDTDTGAAISPVAMPEHPHPLLFLPPVATGGTGEVS